jgi:heme-degrading monooxygenase HmoA
MIVNTTRIVVPAEKRREFVQTINQLRGAIGASKGCIAFNFYVDFADENSSLVMSEWDTEADLNDYLRSEDFAILHGAMATLGIRIDEFKALIYSGSTQIAGRQFSAISPN